MIAASMIGWSADDDSHALQDLKEAGIHGIEIAPSRIWTQWPNVSPEEIQGYHHQNILPTPSMQALLYGMPQASVMNEHRHATAQRLIEVAHLANVMGCRALVFGSPTARRRGALSYHQASVLMKETLLPAADILAAQGNAFAIEASPVQYESDFLQTYAEVADFVVWADHPGIKIHFDLAAALLSDESIAFTDENLPIHAHLSLPFLHPVTDIPAAGIALIQQLGQTDYHGWWSVEQQNHGWNQMMSAVRYTQQLLKIQGVY